MDFEILKKRLCYQTEKRSAFHLGFCSDMDTTAMTYLSNLPILSKNLVAFCCTAPLFPWLISYQS